MRSKNQNNFLSEYKRGREKTVLRILKAIHAGTFKHGSLLRQPGRKKPSSRSFNRGRTAGKSAVGGLAANRFLKEWATRRKKYGRSGRSKFSWDTAQGGQYYARRYYKRGSLGKKRRAGKGGGYRRHVHV